MSRIILAAMVMGMALTLRWPLNVIQFVCGVLLFTVALLRLLPKKPAKRKERP